MQVGKLAKGQMHMAANYPDFWRHVLMLPKDKLPVLLSHLLGAEKY